MPHVFSPRTQRMAVSDCESKANLYVTNLNHTLQQAALERYGFSSFHSIWNAYHFQLLEHAFEQLPIEFPAITIFEGAEAPFLSSAKEVKSEKSDKVKHDKSDKAGE